MGAAAGRRETLHGVEDAAIERHQRDQQQIGKGDAGEIDRQRIALGVMDKAGRQHVDDGGRENERHRQQQQLRQQQQREDAVGEQPCPRRTALLADAGIGRHVSGVEGALGEDGAEMVGQAQSDEKGVGHRPGAQDRRQDDVADKAGDSRQQGEAADREDALNHQSILPRWASVGG